MTAFATAPDLFTYLGRPEWENDELAQAELLLDLVSDEIRAETGQTFDETTHTAALAGTWSRDLELPQRPASAVTSVTIDGQSVGSAGWDWNGRSTLRAGARFDFDSDSWYDLDSAQQGATFRDGLHWGGPSATVTVVYTAGYSTGEIPGDVRAVCIRAAGRALSDPTGTVRSEQLGAYSVTYAGGGREVNAAGPTNFLSEGERAKLRRRYSRTAGTFAAAP